MKYIASFLLLKLTHEEVTPKQIHELLASVGIECDDAKAEKVVNECKGKDVATLIAEGAEKLASVPSGGGGGAASSGGAAAPSGGKAEPAAAPKEEEKEESDEDMGFGLFD